VAKSIFVADDIHKAQRYATEASGPYYAYYRSLVTKLVKNGRANLFKPDQNEPDSSVTVENVVKHCVIWGTPEKVVDELLSFRDQVGDFGTLLYAGHDWRDKELALRSMELMAEKVLPQVNRAISQTD
jgi:alkanesulfonate monooxygenase SsuD/methylene tetrahydromethanopterin reductase-like flavin-dependent oxidoreductase (luciferase family)